MASRCNTTIGEHVIAAASRSGHDVITISEATGIPASDVRACLDGTREFTFGELTDVGGLLRVRLSDLFKGVTA